YWVRRGELCLTLLNLNITHMKNLLFISLLLMISCTKEKTVNRNTVSNLSDTATQRNETAQKDSLLERSETRVVSDSSRSSDGSKIIKTITGGELPITLSDEFTTDQHEYIIKIKDFKGQNISGEILPDDPSMNI